MSGRQEWNYPLERPEFPAEFPRRLERFKEESGLSWRGLARALRLRVRVIQRWRAGGAPSAAHLIRLLEFADEQGQLRCLLPRASQPGSAARRASEVAEDQPSGGDWGTD